MPPTDPQFWPLLDTLMDTLHHHVQHEREEDMPRLEGLLPRAESQALAKAFQRTKFISPTRSHPSAPTEYHFETLAAMMAAPIDRFRDLVERDFPGERDRESAAAEATKKTNDSSQNAAEANTDV